MSDYLTRKELYDLTECWYRKDQLAWLRSEGWAHAVGKKGEIRVLRAYRDQRMGLGKMEQPKPKRDWSNCHA